MGKDSTKSKTPSTTSILSSKQLAELERRNWEIMRGNTTIMNECFEKKLEIDDLLSEGYSQEKQDALYWTIL